MTAQFTYDFFVAKGAMLINVEAKIYTYKEDNAFCAAMFSGNRTEPDVMYRSSWEGDRDTSITNFVADLARREEMKAAQRAFRHPFNVGDLFYYKWGLNQTNCKYYQVVATTAFTVTIREIAAKVVHSDLYREFLLPIPNRFVGPEKVKRPRYSGPFPHKMRAYLSMARGTAKVTDSNTPHYASRQA